MGKYILGDLFEGNYPISQYYGNNPAYYAQFGFAGHEGVDWATPTGVKVIAPFDFQVVQDQDDLKSGAYGDYVVLWDPTQKCAIWYCHLQENYVAFGQKGKKGDVIGLSDNSGNSTGPHLHVNFVETDANGARINLTNGYKGMLNILDPNLVTWQLGGVINPAPGSTPIPGTTNMYKGYDLSNVESMKVAVDVLVRVQSGDLVNKTDLDKQKVLTDNLNQQINDRNNDIVQLNAQISTLNAKALEIQTQLDSATEQAKKVPDLEAQNTELAAQKIAWGDQEKTYNRQVAQLKSDLAEAKANALNTCIKNLWNKLFHRV